MIAGTEEATAVSTWQAAVATPITDEFLEWPADLFALTDVILTRAEVYQFILSPPRGKRPRMRGLDSEQMVGDPATEPEWLTSATIVDLS